MTIAGAIFLIAAGAILRYATNLNVEGVSIDTVGLILMIAGVAGLFLSFLQEVDLVRSPPAPGRRPRRAPRRTRAALAKPGEQPPRY